jgi:hypothetical protein
MSVMLTLQAKITFSYPFLDHCVGSYDKANIYWHKDGCLLGKTSTRLRRYNPEDSHLLTAVRTSNPIYWHEYS